MTETYLDMMIKSLEEKIEILTRIEEENARQKEILSNEEGIDAAAFRTTIDEKTQFIDRINLLNDGFDSLYDHVKEVLEKDKEKYKAEISTMQDQIRQITALSSSIKAEEVRNKALAEKYFKGKREELQQSRKGNDVAYNYYETMNKTRLNMPQFIDKKN